VHGPRTPRFHSSEFPALRPHEVLRKWLFIDSTHENFESTMQAASKHIARMIRASVSCRESEAEETKADRRPTEARSRIPSRGMRLASRVHICEEVLLRFVILSIALAILAIPTPLLAQPTYRIADMGPSDATMFCASPGTLINAVGSVVTTTRESGVVRSYLVDSAQVRTPIGDALRRGYICGPV